MNLRTFGKVASVLIFSGALMGVFNNCSEMETARSLGSESSEYDGKGFGLDVPGELSDVKEGGDGGTVVGNPKPTNIVIFSPYDVDQDQAKHNRPKNDFLATLCIEKIKFKDSVEGPKDQEIKVGEVNLKSGGTFLSGVTFEPGIYEEVELKIKDKCKSKTSLTVENQFGKFKTKDDRKLKFERQFTLTDRSVVELDIADLMNQLSLVNHKKVLEDVLEDFVGDIRVIEQ